ncbi:alpha/beta hydrolase [Aurantivibrio infirmus]
MTAKNEAAKSLKQRLHSLMELSQSQPSLIESIRYVMDHYCGEDIKRLTALTENISVQFETFDGEWFVPSKCNTKRRVLFLHGGGWVSGSVDTHRHLIADIAEQSACAVLAINYRLAPEHKYPKGLNDCIEAYQLICSNGPKQKSEAEEITIIGDSCGGNLSVVTTLHSIKNQLRVPDKLVLLSPVLDVSNQSNEPCGVDDLIVSREGMKQITQEYLEQDSLALSETQEVSPIKTDKSFLKLFPSTLLQVGTEEYLRDETICFAKRLWELNKTVQLSVWPHMPHDFQLFAKELTEAREAIREICQFISPE